jgi:hypothetical protein
MSDAAYFFDRVAKTEPIKYVIDKELACKANMKYMNLKLQKMFHYGDLPVTIPSEMLEYYIINNGTCFVAKVKGELYALTGSFGGVPDAYYRPTRYIVANPGLDISEDYDIVKDGVLMRNDPLWLGLYPLMSKYAALITENMLTLRTADIMLRVMALLTAPDDKMKAAADEYLKNLENGKLASIGENRFFDDGIKMQSPPSNNGSYLTQFIELHQYLTASFYNEIGLNANFNMKRESIGDGESSLNEDTLLPLCEIMLRCRKEDVKKINDMFGTHITVEFDSAWLNNQKEIALKLETLKKEASQLAGGDNNDDAGVTENASVGSSDAISNESSGESDENISVENERNDEGDSSGNESDDSESGESEDSGSNSENNSESGDRNNKEKLVDEHESEDDVDGHHRDTDD